MPIEVTKNGLLSVDEQLGRVHTLTDNSKDTLDNNHPWGVQGGISELVIDTKEPIFGHFFSEIVGLFSQYRSGQK